jgi:hypothetical protein
LGQLSGATKSRDVSMVDRTASRVADPTGSVLRITHAEPSAAAGADLMRVLDIRQVEQPRVVDGRADADEDEIQPSSWEISAGHDLSAPALRRVALGQSWLVKRNPAGGECR